MKQAYMKPEAVKISFELADTIMTVEDGGFVFGSYFNMLEVEEETTVFE